MKRNERYMKKHDVVVVVGGGLTGCAAAIAAARQGMTVLLLEQSGFLGGALGNSLVNPFMVYWTHVEGQGEKRKLQLSTGIFTEICESLEKIGGL